MGHMTCMHAERAAMADLKRFDAMVAALPQICCWGLTAEEMALQK